VEGTYKTGGQFLQSIYLILYFFELLLRPYSRQASLEMPPFIVAPCILDDAPAIARNNVSAFWEDRNWALKWTRKTKSCEYVITQAAHRWPYNLAKDATYRRREKVVDASTGELVGFSTWVLPYADEDEEEERKQWAYHLWPEARGPEVDADALELLKKRFDEADWESDRAMDVLSPPIKQLSAQLRGDKEWLSKYF
jgi:hypothetical protein